MRKKQNLLFAKVARGGDSKWAGLGQRQRLPKKKREGNECRKAEKASKQRQRDKRRERESEREAGRERERESRRCKASVCEREAEPEPARVRGKKGNYVVHVKCGRA